MKQKFSVSANMSDSSYAYLFKFILVGATGVGKSCLLLQLTDKKFNTTDGPTIGSGFGATTITVLERNRIKLRIWDTAGQERYRSITKSFFRDAVGVLLVYDITGRETFTGLPTWLEDLRQHGTENMTIMLLGNKCDLAAKRAVSFEEGQEFAKEHGLLFMECSAKTNENVFKAFATTAETVYKNVEDGVFKPSEVQGIVVGAEANSEPLEGISRGVCCS